MRRVAVLLNRNARRVTPRLVAWFEAQLDTTDLFVVSSPEESRGALAVILSRGYDVLCVGGGDGTFQQLCEDVARDPAPRPPALYALRLGTGNAIADVCGAHAGTKKGIAADLARAAGDAPIGELRLLDVEGRSAHFTGVGLDANWASDYRSIVKERLGRGPLGFAFRGTLGYLATAFGRTVPRLVFKPRLPVRIVALEPAERIGPDGAAAATFAPGETLYEGPVTIAAASTVVPYSAGLPFFPYADRIGDRFQLRVASAGALTTLTSVPMLFAGGYQNPNKIADFAATAVRFELGAPAVWHRGGDVEPETTQLTIRRGPRSVPIVRARPARA